MADYLVSEFKAEHRIGREVPVTREMVEEYRWQKAEYDRHIYDVMMCSTTVGCRCYLCGPHEMSGEEDVLQDPEVTSTTITDDNGEPTSQLQQASTSNEAHSL